jgi:CubicO group peptidase (beta-lactamase class C family)
VSVGSIRPTAVWIRLLVLWALSLAMVRVPAPPGWAQSGRGEVRAGLGAELDGLMRRLEAYGFSGSLLVASHGRVLLDMGYGMADRERGIPYTADTLFDVASISKQFTAAAVLKLEMEGKLKVEDPLAKFLPGVPADKAAITLHQLLTHTSGLKDTFGPEYEPIGRDEFVRRALASQLLLSPGKRYRYSNAGYGLLAAVVEQVSGTPLGTFMREKLFLPAGMHHTGYRLPAWERVVIAHGYGPQGDWGTPHDHPWAADGPYWNLRGNGGVLSTTGDLYRWHLALAGDTILSVAERTKAITPYISEGRAAHSRYGYGWSISASPSGSRLVSHIGGNGIFEADVRRYLDDAAVIVVSSNRADFSALAISPHVQARLFHLPDPQPPRLAPLDPQGAARCAGEYGLPDGGRLQVMAREGRLLVSPQGASGFAVLAGAMSAEARDHAADHAAQVQAALAALQRGEAGPFATLVGLEPEEARHLLPDQLPALERTLGAWSGSEILGEALLGGHVYTYALLRFAHGARYAEFLWEATVEAIHTSESPPQLMFLPLRSNSEAAARRGGRPPSPTYASYEVRDGIVLPIRFEPAEAPVVMIIPTPGGESGSCRPRSRWQHLPAMSARTPS